MKGLCISRGRKGYGRGRGYCELPGLEGKGERYLSAAGNQHPSLPGPFVPHSPYYVVVVEIISHLLTSLPQPDRKACDGRRHGSERRWDDSPSHRIQRTRH